jgi:hypothetical protein
VKLAGISAQLSVSTKALAVARDEEKSLPAWSRVGGYTIWSIVAQVSVQRADAKLGTGDT